MDRIFSQTGGIWKRQTREIVVGKLCWWKFFRNKYWTVQKLQSTYIHIKFNNTNKQSNISSLVWFGLIECSQVWLILFGFCFWVHIVCAFNFVCGLESSNVDLWVNKWTSYVDWDKQTQQVQVCTGVGQHLKTFEVMKVKERLKFN